MSSTSKLIKCSVSKNWIDDFFKFKYLQKIILRSSILSNLFNILDLNLNLVILEEDPELAAP